MDEFAVSDRVIVLDDVFARPGQITEDRGGTLPFFVTFNTPIEDSDGLIEGTWFHSTELAKENE